MIHVSYCIVIFCQIKALGPISVSHPQKMGCAHRVGPVQMPLSRDQGDSESVSAFVCVRVSVHLRLWVWLGVGGWVVGW